MDISWVWRTNEIFTNNESDLIWRINWINLLCVMLYKHYFSQPHFLLYDHKLRTSRSYTNTVETELHALHQCPKHSNDRNEFYEYIEQNNIQSIQDSLNEKQLFIEIMTCLDTETLQALGKFVTKMFKNRLDQEDISVIEISTIWALHPCGYLLNVYV